MIGPITGSSVSELQALLDVVADPKKVSAALASLKKVGEETAKLLDEKSKVEMAIDQKQQKLNDAKAEHDARMEKLLALSHELEEKQKGLAVQEASLKDRERELIQAKNTLADAEFKMSVHSAEKAKLWAESEALVIQKMAEAKAMKEEYENKLAKLKQAMG